MSPGGGRRSAAAVVLVAVATAALVNLATDTVRVSAGWWKPFVWVSSAVLVLVSIWLEWRSRYGQAGASASGEALARLAERVDEQWRREAVARGLTKPLPIRLRWSSTGRPVAAPRDVVLDEPGSTWLEQPLTGDLEDVVDAFRALPHRQLVVLGEPGAGKSVLALRLVLGLTRRWQPGEPVPILLTMTSWDPRVEEAAAFVASRTELEYPFLAERDRDGRSLARTLLARGLLVVILDGLDELDPARLGAAVQALDELAGLATPLVVTCRSREYEWAVGESGSGLSRAAVVELARVDLDQAIGFLAAQEPAKARWAPVFRHLREHPRGVLATTFATPLMMALARTAYQHPNSDPTELVRASEHGSVSGLLLDAFVTSVYREAPYAAAGKPGLRRYRAAKAVRWLETLAIHLYQAGTRDLRWWQLDPGLLARSPGLVRVAVFALTMVATAGVGAILGGLTTGSWLAAGACAAIAVVVAVVADDRWRRRAVLFAVACGGLLVVLGFDLADAGWIALGGGVAMTVLGRFFPPVGLVVSGVPYGLLAGLTWTALAMLVTDAWPRAQVAGVVAAVTYAAVAALGSDGRRWAWFGVTHLTLATRGLLPFRLNRFLDDAHRRETLRKAGTVWQFRHALLQDHLVNQSHVIRIGGYRARDWPTARSLAMRLNSAPVDHEREWDLRHRATAGQPQALVQLAHQLAQRGETDEAAAVLRRQADSGDVFAAEMLSQLLRDQGNVDELRFRASAGDWAALRQLTAVLRIEDRVDDLRSRAETETGVSARQAASQLADMLSQRGDLTGATEVLSRHRDDGGLVSQLARLLRDHGDTGAAIAVLREYRATGNRRAARYITEELRRLER